MQNLHLLLEILMHLVNLGHPKDQASPINIYIHRRKILCFNLYSQQFLVVQVYLDHPVVQVRFR